MEKQVKDKISEFLGKEAGRPIDICAELYYRFLKKEQGNAAEVLQFFYEEWSKYDFDTEATIKPRFKNEQYQDVQKKIGLITVRVIKNLLDKFLPVEEFYQKLWETFSNSTLFAEEIEIICAICIGMQTPAIPYYCPPKISEMDDTVYGELTLKYFPQIQELRFAILNRYSQKTQVATYLQKLFVTIKDPEAQKVLMAQAFAVFETYGEASEKGRAEATDAE